MNQILDSLSQGWWMFYETLWALVLGFALSGAVQAFVTRAQMKNLLGDRRPASIARASFFGMVSSSCSYAASALARSIFTKGADFTASMIFMFASTNLVVELGIVLWILIGWQFALAEFVGGSIMILLLWAILPRFVSKPMASKARGIRELEMATTITTIPLRTRIKNRTQWKAAAGYTIGDFTMMRWELIIGFIVSGFAAVMVPAHVWQSLFITDHGIWTKLENAFVAPFIAFISFVCSVGNVPLAATLWHGGISFGGTISFIFADLLSLPLVLIYIKYFGRPLTLRLVLVFWFVMSVSGLLTEEIFALLNILPERHHMNMAMGHIGWNRTTILNVIALILLALLFWIYKSKSTQDSEFAKDLVCGMQVRIADAPASCEHNGNSYYFCMPGCKESFLENTAKYIER
ncbi:unannotated protein [freshwater metagenome]|uniref:Unannotated protein n=1 Tax=freshwater metagenome TaxID=449393 RepID=A0A6J6ATJ3_9ZZZZ|nr:YHS domain-containing protein [Actinomycetota bacterium]MSW98961.1 YHS domain-containing protein [Actinomycetota bacterium]MSY82792.1 YHS domain-containing protein [Actinomycetota bacterium]MSZ45325.1 YHS domain-containing protein [Actinomycetota bacterium]MTA03978.1 YHS domain-containing protein [Actinomycetota bacterium]